MLVSSDYLFHEVDMKLTNAAIGQEQGKVSSTAETKNTPFLNLSHK